MTPGMQLTYDSEGMEKPGSKWHSRVAHVPGPWSGLTIGRGVDCAQRPPSMIRRMLIEAGVSEDIAGVFSMAGGTASRPGVRGRKAKAFIVAHGLNEFEITQEQQRRLFKMCYDEKEATTQRIYEKPGCRDAYGWSKPWSSLDPKIRGCLVDMCFRGDYIPKTRKKLASAIAQNNIIEFTRIMSLRYWLVQRRVPRDRFNRRVKYLSEG